MGEAGTGRASPGDGLSWMFVIRTFWAFQGAPWDWLVTVRTAGWFWAPKWRLDGKIGATATDSPEACGSGPGGAPAVMATLAPSAAVAV